jgi:phosphoribosylamine--glycine ligase
MKVLVIGSGGREHALVWKICQSSRVSKVYCAPGNAGIAEQAELVALAADDIDELCRFAEKERIDLTVVGPEIPLSMGIVDLFEARGLRVFGPNRDAAQLEGSKAFSKDLMRQQGVPTAAFGVFSDPSEASSYIEKVGAPIVVKADGLAAGKGVLLCATQAEAQDAVIAIMRDRQFGEAGNQVVIEEFLQGEEASFLAFTDGGHILPLASSQDHKQVFDGDKGPNTGGMGAYSPAPVVTPALADQIVQEVLIPVVRGLKQRNIVYKGVLYAGLMIQAGQAKVLEFNVRFGDPECQPLMLRMRSDLVEVMDAVIDERLDHVTLDWDERPAVCVVLTAAGYPGSYEKEKTISGLEQFSDWQDGAVFHAGTKRTADALVTNGGRVLGVTATGTDISRALSATYQAVERISWSGMHYRRDIGQRALKRDP